MRLEDFPAYFTEGVAKPKPEGFIEHFLPLVHPEGRFIQPMVPTRQGKDGFTRLFRGVFETFPDMEFEVYDSAVNPEQDTVFIYFTQNAKLGGRRRSWYTVDRFLFREELIYERRTLFDPMPLLGPTLLTPRMWSRLIRLQASRSGT